MASLQAVVSSAAVRGYHAILCRQDPHTCWGYVRAESRWTTTARPCGSWTSKSRPTGRAICSATRHGGIRNRLWLLKIRKCTVEDGPCTIRWATTMGSALAVPSAVFAYPILSIRIASAWTTVLGVLSRRTVIVEPVTSYEATSSFQSAPLSL